MEASWGQSLCVLNANTVPGSQVRLSDCYRTRLNESPFYKWINWDPERWEMTCPSLHNSNEIDEESFETCSAWLSSPLYVLNCILYYLPVNGCHYSLNGVTAVFTECSWCIWETKTWTGVVIEGCSKLIEDASVPFNMLFVYNNVFHLIRI